jgi:hypothetical protein
LAPANSSLADPDDDHVPENARAPSLHHSLGVITERVQDAMNFIVAPSLAIRFD